MLGLRLLCFQFYKCARLLFKISELMLAVQTLEGASLTPVGASDEVSTLGILFLLPWTDENTP